MLTLTLQATSDGTISFKAENDYIRVIGEFLTVDAVAMPDFIRALLTSDGDESVTMDACVIETNGDLFTIKHLHTKELPTISLTKERMLQVLDIWEDFLAHQRQEQWIFFKEEDFGLPASTDELSKKWNEMEEKISVMMQKKNKQKETE